MKSSLVPISILIASLLIVGVILFAGENSGDNAGNNVSIVDGKQIIEIDAKGGYNPRKTAAKADIPTVLKIEPGKRLRFSLKKFYICSTGQDYYGFTDNSDLV